MVAHAAAHDHRSGLSAGVDEIGVCVLPLGRGAAADNANLGLQPKMDAFGQVVYA